MLVALQLILQRYLTLEHGLFQLSKLLTLSYLAKEIYTAGGLGFELNQIVDQRAVADGLGWLSDACLLWKPHGVAYGELVSDSQIEGLLLEVSNIQISAV